MPCRRLSRVAPRLAGTWSSARRDRILAKALEATTVRAGSQAKASRATRAAAVSRQTFGLTASPSGRVVEEAEVSKEEALSKAVAQAVEAARRKAEAARALFPTCPPRAAVWQVASGSSPRCLHPLLTSFR